MKLHALVLIATAFARAAVAQAPSGGGEQVDITGCPVPGVEGGCLILKAKDGTVYDITSANPKPKTGYLGIRVKGVKSSQPTTCMQGTRLDKIKWSYTRQKCSVKNSK